MIGKQLGNCSRFLLVLGLEFLKHGGHSARIITGGPHVLNAQLVCFFFSATTEFQKGHAFNKRAGVIEDVTDYWSTKEDSSEHAIIDSLLLRLILHRVTRSYVRNLMSHHAGQFGLVVCGQNQTFVHIEKATRKRKRVHLVGVDNLDRKWDFGV